MDDGINGVLLSNGHPFRADSSNMTSGHSSSNGYHPLPSNGYHCQLWTASSLSNGSDSTQQVTPATAVNGSQAEPCSLSDLKTDSNEGREPVEEESVGQQEEQEETPEIDINLSNVVCNFRTRCHLNLRTIANRGSNVEFKKANNVLIMRIRNPNATAMIRSTGNISVTGSRSEEAAKANARKIARKIQKCGFPNVKLSKFRINNVLANVNFPFGIRLEPFTEQHQKVCSYEPELQPGALYRWKERQAVLTIHQTGSMTITAPNVAAVDAAVQHIYPLVFEHKKEKPMDNPLHAHMKALKRSNGGHGRARKRLKCFHGSVDDFLDDDDDMDDFIDDEDEEDSSSLSQEEEEAVETDSESD